MRRSEYWLNKLGIGLLLLGVAFLFKYSIDRGWLTPVIRVGIGLAISTGLLVLGLRLYGRRREFSQVLLGGAVGSYYLCGFAAFQILALVSHGTALVYMVAVTVLALVLALRQDAAVLSVIGAIGGLGTPFLLYTGAGSVPGLVAYTCTVLAGTSLIYLHRGWRSLLWVSAAGGWIVWATALDRGIRAVDPPVAADQSALQLGVVFAWLAFGILPTLREVVAGAYPGRWRLPSLGLAERVLQPAQLSLLTRHVHLLALSSPLLALGLSAAIWSLPAPEPWGWVSLAGAALYAVGQWLIGRRPQARALAHTHRVVSLVLLTLGLGLLFRGNALLLSLAAEAVALQWLGRRLEDRPTQAISHLIAAGVGLVLVPRLLHHTEAAAPLLDPATLTDLAVIAAAAGLAAVCRGGYRVSYVLVAYAALAAWLDRGLSGSALLVSLACEAAVLRLLSERLKDDIVPPVVHATFGALMVWVLVRELFQAAADPPLLSLQALADALVIALTVGASLLPATAGERLAYRIVAHVGLLGWLLRELSHAGDGPAWATMGWGVYGVVLLVAGLRLDRGALSVSAVATLVLAAGKLLVFDLSELDPVWRVLLFLGFGGVFLALSYSYQTLWRHRGNSSPPDGQAAPPPARSD
jgi:uncharacterized membrane protein